MRPPDRLPSDSCADTLGRLDAYLDGELPPDAARAVEVHCAGCPACAEELAFARAVQDALHAWTPAPCPQRVVDAARAEIRVRRTRTAAERLRAWSGALVRPALRPALALATAGLIALSLFILRPAGVETESYTRVEVDQAVADVQRTLAILSEVGHRTGVIVREDVLEPHVVAPVQRTVDDLLHP